MPQLMEDNQEDVWKNNVIKAKKASQAIVHDILAGRYIEGIS